MVEYFKQKNPNGFGRPPIDRSGASTLVKDRDGNYSLPRRKGGVIPDTGFKDGYSGRYFAPTRDADFKPAAPPSNPGRQGHRYNQRYDDYGGARDKMNGRLPSFRKWSSGAFGFIMDNAEDLQNWDWTRFFEKGDLPWGLSGDEIVRRLDEANGIIRPGQPGSDNGLDVEYFPDKFGKDWWASFPKGGSACTNQPQWWPGRPIADGPRYPGERRLTNIGHLRASGSTCTTWTYQPDGVDSQNRVEAGIKGYISAYSQEWYWDAQLGQEWGYVSDTQPFYGRSYGTTDLDAKMTFVQTELGAPRPDEELGLGKPKPAMYMPGETTFGRPPDPNVSYPTDWDAAIKAAGLLNGTRQTSGYHPQDDYSLTPGTQVVIQLPTDNVPGGGGSVPPPTTGTTNPEPWFPGKKQEKFRIQGMGAFRLVQSVFHGLSEADDFIESFYDALPKKRQTCKGQTVGGPTCKAMAVGKYWDEVDKVEGIVNLIVNHFEDKYIGKIMAQRDKAAARWGTKDWKIFNEAGPVDDPMFEAYGEIAKNIVNPTKEGITSAVKQYFGIN